MNSIHVISASCVNFLYYRLFGFGSTVAQSAGTQHKTRRVTKSSPHPDQVLTLGRQLGAHATCFCCALKRSEHLQDPLCACVDFQSVCHMFNTSVLNCFSPWALIQYIFLSSSFSSPHGDWEQSPCRVSSIVGKFQVCSETINKHMQSLSAVYPVLNLNYQHFLKLWIHLNPSGAVSE